MESGEEEITEDTVTRENIRDQRIKQMILEENFKKAETTHVSAHDDKEIGIPSKKRPFLHSGLILIAVAIICLLIINEVPWFYLRCDAQEGMTIEDFFYRGFESRSEVNCSKITGMFTQQNGTYPIGLTLSDFENTYRYSYYSLISMIIIGLIFTIFVVLNRVYKYSIEISVMVQSIFSIIPAFICVFLLILFIKFLAGHLIFYHNTELISEMFPNAYISFPTPLIMIIILAFILKIQFTIMKLNYRELEKKFEPERKDKKSYTYRI